MTLIKDLCYQGLLSEAQLLYNAIDDKLSVEQYLSYYLSDICILGHLDVAQWLYEITKRQLDMDVFIRTACQIVSQSSLEPFINPNPNNRTLMLEWIIEMVINNRKKEINSIEDFMEEYGINDLCSDVGYNGHYYKDPLFDEALIIINAFIRHKLIDKMTHIVIYETTRKRCDTIKHPLDELFYQCCISGYLIVAKQLFERYHVNIHYVSLKSEKALCTFEETCRHKEFEVACWLASLSERYVLNVCDKILTKEKRKIYNSRKQLNEHLDANEYEYEETIVIQKKYTWSILSII